MPSDQKQNYICIVSICTLFEVIFLTFQKQLVMKISLKKKKKIPKN